MTTKQNDASVSAANSPIWLAELSLLSVAVIWGVNIPIMKIALAMQMDRFALNGLRLVISSATLLCFAALEYRRGIRPQLRQNWPRLLAYALVVSVLYQMLFLLAVSQTTSADIALIMATVPMWTAIGARIFLREILVPRAWLGLWVAFAGTVIVTLQGSPGSPATASDSTQTVITETDDADRATALLTVEGLEHPAAVLPDKAQDSAANVQATEAETLRRFMGNLIALAAALMWSGGTILSRPMLQKISPVQLAVAWPALPASLELLKQIPMDLCLLYSGVLSTGLALPMWSYGVKLAGAAHATMFQNLSPVVAIIAAWLMLGEPLSAAQIIGGVLILGGLIVMRSART
jgi:drug/metabolite transporter (DMT)-like permease